MERRSQEWLEAGSHFEWVPTERMRHASMLNIFHAEFGDPEAQLLLMVHGFPSSSIDWQDVVGELSGGIVKTCGLGCFRRPPFRLIRPVRAV
jgi:pimeloyl-ACP methyl ester carboxylesterase